IVTARPYNDVNGKLVGVVHSFQDITERIRAEDDLAEERERLAVTLRSIGDGVVTTDTEGTVILLNKVSEDLTGWSQEEAVGRPFADVVNIINEKTRLPAESPVEKVLQFSKTIGLANRRVLVSKDGIERNIADSASPILDKNKEVIGVVVVLRDITEEKIIEEELLKIKKLESIGVLAGGIAHDFNNILTAIMGNLNLASFMIKPGDGVYKLLKDTEKASLRAKNLTQQLLTFSKGGAPIKRLASVVDIIKDSASFILRGSNIKCEYEFDEVLWPVEIDSGLISQVIQNIILNASAVMPEGGIVKVSCKNYCNDKHRIVPVPDERLVEIAIQDSGAGIAVDLLEKIFDPYFTTKQEGTGLGLAICHSIISKHGGHISVKSVPDHGSTFKIYLVASEDKLDNFETEGTDLVPVTGSGKVMVMDDEETVRDVAAMMLSYCGYEVVKVSDGREAVDRYKKNGDGGSIDLIIMDITIPGGMGGKEAIKEIININPNAKVIVASGYSNDPIMADYRKYGFRAAVAKPFTLEQLSIAVNRVLSAEKYGSPCL
ncbi:MAG: PAS domain S-box protein, partial [Desulfobulbaceae bacterium]|nr:PAS domain S-box protein [Desulfobulbaceae bacterium]